MRGFFARIDAILHKIAHPKHKIIWRDDIEEGICAGDIVCETCGTVYWCRNLGMKIFNRGYNG